MVFASSGVVAIAILLANACHCSARKATIEFEISYDAGRKALYNSCCKTRTFPLLQGCTEDCSSEVQACLAVNPLPSSFDDPEAGALKAITDNCRFTPPSWISVPGAQNVDSAVITFTDVDLTYVDPTNLYIIASVWSLPESGKHQPNFLDLRDIFSWKLPSDPAPGTAVVQTASRRVEYLGDRIMTASFKYTCTPLSGASLPYCAQASTSASSTSTSSTKKTTVAATATIKPATSVSETVPLASGPPSKVTQPPTGQQSSSSSESSKTSVVLIVAVAVGAALIALILVVIAVVRNRRHKPKPAAAGHILLNGPFSFSNPVASSSVHPDYNPAMMNFRSVHTNGAYVDQEGAPEADGTDTYAHLDTHA